MKRLLTFAILVTSTVVASATDLTDPVEILKRADAAIRAVKSVRYSATRRVSGSLQGKRANVRGKVVMAGWKIGAMENFRIDATAMVPSTGKPMDVTTLSNGEDFGLIDHRTKRAYVDIDPGVIGVTGRTARVLEMVEYVHPTPFSEEINGRKHELIGSRIISGVDCYEVHVVYASASQQSYWFFSKKDFLARGVRRVFPTQDGGSTSIELLLEDLEIGVKLDKNLFEFEVPEGYRQIDDFAP